MSAFRYSSGLPGAPPQDIYINVQCKTSWSPLGHQVANLAPHAAQASRARPGVAGLGRSCGLSVVEFNFTGHELDLRRFMMGFRRCVEILGHPAVRDTARLTFPVKFNDRLRRLNRITTGNKIKSAVIAGLIDAVPQLAEPIFATLADRRIDLAALVQDDDALAADSGKCRRHLPSGRHLPHGRREDDRDAVTDPAGRVHGFEALRVIDASIMPTIPRGNTNIPTIMVAEKLADAMLQQA